MRPSALTYVCVLLSWKSDSSLLVKLKTDGIVIICTSILTSLRRILFDKARIVFSHIYIYICGKAHTYVHLQICIYNFYCAEQSSLFSLV